MLNNLPQHLTGQPLQQECQSFFNLGKFSDGGPHNPNVCRHIHGPRQKEGLRCLSEGACSLKGIAHRLWLNTFKCHALMLEQATGVGSSMLCYPGSLLKRWLESLGIPNNFLWLTSIMLHSRGCYRSHHKTHSPFFSKSGHRKHRMAVWEGRYWLVKIQGPLDG